MMSECRYKFGAVIAKGKIVVSVGVNIFKTHPVYKNYGSYVNSIHAEYYALLKAGDVTGCTMYIARQSINPHSKPCKVCRQLIKESGIREICYHDGKQLVKEKI
jgi:deoxycytidylate deaminase